MTEKTQIDEMVEESREIIALNLKLRDSIRKKIRKLNSIASGMDSVIKEQTILANELEGLFIEL